MSPARIAGRAVTGSAFNLAAQGITLVVGFVRLVLLARLLMPEEFGLFGLALFFANLLNALSSFGLNAALVQRADETPEAVSTHFVLRMLLSVVAFLVAFAILPLIAYAYPDQAKLLHILISLVAIHVVVDAGSTPLTLLSRRLAFRRIAVLNTLTATAMLITAPLLAYCGWGVWSLVIGEKLVRALISLVGVYCWQPPWRPSLHFSRSIAKGYLGFGWHVLLTKQLAYLLDRFDDFWVGSVLGSTALGLYTRAYEFAQYPRQVVVSPLQSIFYATYARLQGDPDLLSKAYTWTARLVIRAGFLFSLAMFVMAPQFVHLLLGARWLPMVTTLRLMVVYCLFDSLLTITGSLITAVGRPRILTWVKSIQLLVFVPSVIVLGRLFHSEGVAIAVDVVLLIGLVITLREVRRVVRFSVVHLLAVPALGALLGGAAAIGVSNAWLSHAGLWVLLLVKCASALAVYGLTLIAFEWRDYWTLARALPRIVRGSRDED